MLHLDPAKRISAADALKHPYFHTAPLPCDPSDFPNFNGDFHEYTVRKDKSQMQNKLALEKKNSGFPNRKHNNPEIEGVKKRPKSRGSYHSNPNHKMQKGPNGIHNKTSYHKNVSFEKQSKPYEKNHSETHLSGVKRQHAPLVVATSKQPETKSKWFAESLSNNLQPTPGLLSLVQPSTADVQMSADEQKASPAMNPIDKLRESHKKQKKRDAKGDSKGQGRGNNE